MSIKIPVFKKADFSFAAKENGLYDPEKVAPILFPIWEAAMAKQFPEEIAKINRYKHKLNLFMFVGIGDPSFSLTEIYNAIGYRIELPSTAGRKNEFWWSPAVEGFIRPSGMSSMEKTVLNALRDAWCNGQAITPSLFVPQTFECLEDAIKAFICPNWELDLEVSKGLSLGMTNKKEWKIGASGIRIAFRTPEDCWEFVQNNSAVWAESKYQMISSAATKFVWQPRTCR